MEELNAAETELSNLLSEIKRLEAESTALNAEETNFWRSRNAFSLSLEQFQNERNEVNIKYDHDARLLERLQRTNVYNDAFCITHDGFFGVINGLRLGRLPNRQVESFQEKVLMNRLNGMRLMLHGVRLYFSSQRLRRNSISNLKGEHTISFEYLTTGIFCIQWVQRRKSKKSDLTHLIRRLHRNQRCSSSFLQAIYL